MWRTQNGKVYKVNISQENIYKMQERGARLCFMDYNKGICDKNNKKWYSKTTESLYDGTDTEIYKLNDDVTVFCHNGEKITGYIIHWVHCRCASAPDIKNWFIIMPGVRPFLSQKKKNNDIIITDL